MYQIRAKWIEKESKKLNNNYWAAYACFVATCK